MFFKRNKEEVNILNRLYPKVVYNGVAYILEGIPYYIKNQKIYKFSSMRAWYSWYLVPSIVHGLPDLPTGGTLGFRDGSLIQNAKDGRIYLISDAKRRLITVPLKDLGFDISDVEEVSDAEIEFHTEGEDI